MSKNSSGNYESSVCKGCYSARILNVYPSLRKKLEEIDTAPEKASLDDFKSDIEKIKKTGLRFIRFYSLGDWTGPSDNPYIKAAGEIMPVELFSKRLHFAANLKYLKEIASYKGVNISLSFNKNLVDRIPVVFDYLKNNGLLRNVQLNYTFIGDEEVRKINHISVYHHTKPTGKIELKKFFGKNRVCCMKDEAGKEIFNNKISNSHGSCAKCMLCKLPAADYDGNVLVPKLLSQLYI